MDHIRFHRETSLILFLLGLLLLIVPKNWLPSFYHPIFLGVLFLLSPLLIYAPTLLLTRRSSERKRLLVVKMRSIAAFSIIMNTGGELGLFQLYRFGFEYDKLAHFLVPMLLAFILAESLRAWEHFSRRKIILLVFLIAFLVGLFWELLEWGSDRLFHTDEWGVLGTHVAGDTYHDIIFNTLGSIAGLFIFCLPPKIKKSAQEKAPLQ